MFKVLRELVLTYKILGQQNSTGLRAWWVAAPIDSRARINQSNSYRTILIPFKVFGYSETP
jgi:hypothetical protein